MVRSWIDFERFDKTCCGIRREKSIMTPAFGLRNCKDGVVILTRGEEGYVWLDLGVGEELGAQLLT